MRKKTNIDNWSRRKAFQTFCDFDDPYTGVTTTLNITNMVYLVKKTTIHFMI